MSDNLVHSTIGASSMSRWSKCPGSVKLSEGIESTSSVYAEEGTKAHELAAAMLMNLHAPTAGYNQDMVDAAIEYVDVILGDPHCMPILVEHGFQLSDINERCFGTADAVTYEQSNKLLRVYDFKYGAGIPVEAEENLQMFYYALGAMLTTDFRPHEIELVIIQPRCFHPDGPVRRARYPLMRLLEFADQLTLAVERTEAEDAPLVPGDHCRFCPALTVCPKMEDMQTSLAVEEFDDVSLNAFTPEKLSEVLEKLPVLESYIKAVREFAYRQAMDSKEVPGWKLVDKRATRKWNGDNVAAFLSRKFKLANKDLYKPVELKSPTQIEKLLKKDQKEALKPYVIKQSSGYNLVPESDKRPAIASSIDTDFDVIT